MKLVDHDHHVNLPIHSKDDTIFVWIFLDHLLFVCITGVKCQCRSCSLERRIVLSLSNRIKLVLVKLMREDGCRMGSHLLASRSAGRISGSRVGKVEVQLSDQHIKQCSCHRRRIMPGPYDLNTKKLSGGQHGFAILDLTVKVLPNR